MNQFYGIQSILRVRKEKCADISPEKVIEIIQNIYQVNVITPQNEIIKQTLILSEEHHQIQELFDFNSVVQVWKTGKYLCKFIHPWFFTGSYKSLQRGGNENQNGLIRQILIENPPSMTALFNK